MARINMGKMEVIAHVDPFHVAACMNDVARMEILLSQGQSVDARHNDTTALHKASQRGRYGAVRLLLDNGANLEAKTEDGDNCTPLHLAAEEMRKDVCELLLDRGANVNVRDRNWWTPSHHVCETAFSADIVRLMIEKGANINAITNDGRSCLHLIAEKTAAQNLDQPTICQILIDKGCRVDMRDRRFWTALHCAAWDGQSEVCKILIANKADVGIGPDGGSPLYCAIHQGHDQIVELLLDNGFEVNAQHRNNWTALHFAADQNRPHIAELLVEVYNADPSLPNDDGQTPLHIAALRGNLAVGEKLMSYSNRADINAILPESGATALHLLSMDEDNSAFVKALLDHGAYYNCTLKLPGSFSPLEMAKKKDRVSVVRILEQVDAMLTAVKNNDYGDAHSLIDKLPVNARDGKSGKSALHFAVDNGNLELVNYLLSKGARVDLQSRAGYTPLHLALAAKRHRIATTLTKHAVAKLVFEDLNRFLDAKTVDEGETALHLAVKSEVPDIVKLLVKSGARYNSQSKNGSTPADLATGELKIYFKAIDDLFSHAVSDGSRQVLAVLDKEPTVINAKDDRLGATVLYAALERNCTDLARTLLEREASVCLVTNKGNTALHIASLRGNSGIIGDLISRCPKAKKVEFVNFKTSGGKHTALHVATDEDVVRELKRNGADGATKRGKPAIDFAARRYPEK